MVTSVAWKTLMALTGLFLCVFLVVHLLGNLQLFLPAAVAQPQFNRYAAFLADLPVIKVAAYLTYFSVVAHSIIAVVLAVRNRTSTGGGSRRGNVDRLSPWNSRFMGVLGAVILLFLIVHLRDFWYPFKFGADLGVDSQGRRDLFGLVVTEFRKPWKVGLYVVGVLAVGFHVGHGLYSGFRSLGLSHPGYSQWLRRVSLVFAVGMTVGFAAMPVYICLFRQNDTTDREAAVATDPSPAERQF